MELSCGVEGRTTATWIPSVVFTVVTLVTGLMALLLPETLNRPLPETIEEIESWTRSLVPRGPRLTGDGSAQVRPSVRPSLGPFHGAIAVPSCLLYTSPSPRDRQKSRMPSSA